LEGIDHEPFYRSYLLRIPTNSVSPYYCGSLHSVDRDAVTSAVGLLWIACIEDLVVIEKILIRDGPNRDSGKGSFLDSED
jgi:hypothetical protein